MYQTNVNAKITKIIEKRYDDIAPISVGKIYLSMEKQALLRKQLSIK